MPETVPSWLHVWRVGFAPQFSTAGLEALARALETDDERLLQGGTTSPPPLLCVQDWPVASACPVAFTGWQGDGLQTIGEVSEYFGRVCFECDALIGEPAGCRFFLNWFDESPREEVRQALLAEVRQELARRKELQAS